MSPSTANLHADRINAIEAHLSAYKREGNQLDAELSEVTQQRRYIDGTHLLTVAPVDIRRDSFGATGIHLRGNPILLGATAEDAAKLNALRGMAPASARFDAMAGVPIRALLKAWLNEREADVRARLAAWQARDPIAEAIASIANPNRSEAA